MPRAGRKRNMDAERYPSGEVKHRAEDETLVARLGRLNSLKDVLREIGLPDYIVTELNVLCAKGLIMEIQRMAGERWKAVVDKHRRIVMCAPPVNPAIMDPNRVRGVSTDEPDEQAIKRAAEQYDQAFCAVVDARNGVKIMRAVNRLCLENERPMHGDLLLVREGLNRLAQHFGLTMKPKRD